jgi:hypothetical protein
MNPRRSSRFRAGLLTLLGVSAFAQVSSEAKYEEVLRRAFDAHSSAVLPCEAAPIQPELDFSLRFQAGYTLNLPLGQVDGSHHHAVIALRVTPESGRPVYLLSQIDFRDTAASKLDRHVRSGFVVGAGKYNVEMLYADELHRDCRSEWRIEAKLDGSKRRLLVALPPLTVAGFSSATNFPPPPANLPNLSRLTILMQVAPPAAGLAKLPVRDALKLLGTLSALLEQLHAQLAGLVVFDLEQQKILLRKEPFTAADLQEVPKLLSEVKPGLVDYSALQNPKGALDLLTQLTEEEGNKLHASDALVFLGLHRQGKASIRSGMVKKFRDGPRIFYLECGSPLSFLSGAQNSGIGITAETGTVPTKTPYYDDTNSFDRSSALDQPDGIDDGDHFSLAGQDNVESLSPVEHPDIIEQLVKRLKGEVIAIRKPSDSARAIERIAPHAKQQYTGGFEKKNMIEQSADQPTNSAR